MKITHSTSKFVTQRALLGLQARQCEGGQGPWSLMESKQHSAAYIETLLRLHGPCGPLSDAVRGPFTSHRQERWDKASRITSTA